MKKKNKKDEPPLWREANYYLGWLFILIYVAIQFLYQYRINDALAVQGVLSPVPDSHSIELANQPYLVLRPTATPTPKEEIEVEETIDEQIEEYGKFLFGEDWDLFKRVIWCESRNNPRASNGYDTGLAQINVVHGIPQRWLEDYRINLAVAKKLFDKQGLQPWSASKRCWDKK